MKKFIQPSDLRDLSFQLAAKVGFAPDFMVALRRGGTPIGCYVHEFLKAAHHVPIDHIPIRTSRYTNIDEASEDVQIFGLDYLFQNVKRGQTVLIVDDVWDAGTTISKILQKLDVLSIKVYTAVIYFKPSRNKTLLKPDFYCEETDQWLVFPHELEGLSETDIGKYYPVAHRLLFNTSDIPQKAQKAQKAPEEHGTPDKPCIAELLACVPREYRRQLLQWCNGKREMLFCDKDVVVLSDDDLSGNAVEQFALDRMIGSIPGDDLLKYVFIQNFAWGHAIFHHVPHLSISKTLDRLYSNNIKEWDNDKSESE